MCFRVFVLDSLNKGQQSFSRWEELGIDWDFFSKDLCEIFVLFLRIFSFNYIKYLKKFEVVVVLLLLLV